MRHFLPVLCLLLVLAVPVSAQEQQRETWNWQQCIDYALQNNLQVKRSVINTSYSELLLKQNKLAMTPNVNVSADNSYSFGRSLDPTTYSYVDNQLTITNRFQFTVDQPLFEGLRNYYNVRKSKSDLKALELENQALKEDIQLNILSSYLNILNAEEQLRQARVQRERTLEQQNTTRTLIEAGAIAEASLNDIDAQLSADDLSISQMENQRLLAYHTLYTILQLPAGQEIAVAPINVDAVDISTYMMPAVMDVYNTAIDAQPRVLGARQRLESYHLGIKASKGNYYPTLSLFSTIYTNHSNRYQKADGTYSISPIGALESDPSEIVISYFPNLVNSKFFDQLGDNLSYAFGLSLNIPIYNKRLAWLGVQQSKLDLESAVLDQSQSELVLYDDIKQAWLNAQAAIDHYKAARIALESAERSLAFADDRFKAGSINLLELNLANNNVSAMQSRLTQAKYEFLFNTRILDYYMGKPIQF